MRSGKDGDLLLYHYNNMAGMLGILQTPPCGQLGVSLQVAH